MNDDPSTNDPSARRQHTDPTDTPTRGGTMEDAGMKNWLMKLFGRGPGEQLDCHAVGELLQQYLDDEIDPKRGALIAAHLEDCRRCGLEADTYEQIKRTLASQRSDVPEESVERLREFGRSLIRGEEPSTQ